MRCSLAFCFPIGLFGKGTTVPELIGNGRLRLGLLATDLVYWRIEKHSFDGRALLEYLPSRADPIALETRQDRDVADELNFERYRDLVEVDRLEGELQLSNLLNLKFSFHSTADHLMPVAEQDRLVEIEEEWTNILAKHKALLAMLNPK